MAPLGGPTVKTKLIPPVTPPSVEMSGSEDVFAPNFQLRLMAIKRLRLIVWIFKVGFRKSALISYVAGANPQFTVMDGFLKRICNEYNIEQIHTMSCGFSL